MVDASAVKQKVKNMPKRSKAMAHIPSHKHCRVCGIDISAKAEERVCKNEDCVKKYEKDEKNKERMRCLLYTSPSPRDAQLSRMPSSA